MNRYYYLIVWLNLFVMPCCAMTNPFAFGHFGSPPQQPVESALPEEEAPFVNEMTSENEPELPGMYGKNVITAESYPEQVEQEPLQMEEEELLEEPVLEALMEIPSLDRDHQALLDAIDALPTAKNKQAALNVLNIIVEKQSLLIQRRIETQQFNEIVNQVKTALEQKGFSNPIDNNISNFFAEGESLLPQLFAISYQHASQGISYLQKIIDQLSSNAEDREQQAENILQKIKGLLTPPQAPSQPLIPTPPSAQQIPTPAASQPLASIAPEEPSTPTSRPSAAPAPSASPAVPSTPVIPSPAKPQAPGKAHESITKANSKLSSALRRLDAIKGYYKEINQEERKVIKKKAENVLKEYQSDITKFVRRIEQVKNELGGRADQSKLAPFNTFIDLTNKLSQGIKKL